MKIEGLLTDYELPETEELKNIALPTYRHQLAREELIRLEKERAQHEQNKNATQESHHRKKGLPRDEDEAPKLESGEHTLQEQGNKD